MTAQQPTVIVHWSTVTECGAHWEEAGPWLSSQIFLFEAWDNDQNQDSHSLGVKEGTVGSKVWAGEGDTSGGVSQSSGAAPGLGARRWRVACVRGWSVWAL